MLSIFVRGKGSASCGNEEPRAHGETDIIRALHDLAALRWGKSVSCTRELRKQKPIASESFAPPKR